MKSRLFGIFALSILVLTMALSGVSATISLSSSSLSPFTNTNQYQNLTVTGNETSMNFSVPTSPYFSINQIGSINGVSSAHYNISLKNIPSNIINYGDSYAETVNFSVTNLTNPLDNSSIPVTLTYLKSFCNSGDQNDTGLTMYVTITNNGNGASDTQWQPLDSIDVQVELDNNQNNDLSNVYLVMGLIKGGTNNNVAGNLDWLQDSEKVQVGDIASGDNYKYDFQFKVNPDIKTGSYRLFIKAYSYDSGENNLCIDHSNDLSSYSSSNYYADVSVTSPTSSKAVIVDSSSLPASTTAQCNQQITLTPTVYNIGSADYKNQVFVRLYNTELGLDLNQTLYGDLNSGEGMQVPFTFTVPMNAAEKTYTLSFLTYYGYTTTNNGYYIDGNYYRYVSDNIFTTQLTVKGNCVYATPETTQVNAQLQSGGKAGEPLVIEATVGNTGNRTVSYNFGLEGYSSWATLSSINPLNITLSPGQSQVITVTLNPNSDASGDKLFYLDTYSNSYLITKQPLQISITPKFWASITGGAISGGNWYVWGIGLLNLILVVAIVIIIVKVAKRK
ncbi:MAG: putative S-layer protein [Candidatus Pacearchaeota archaeon]|nr:putative S-layer protein [Candidatus Pacearchaeota archaeon]